MLKYTLRRLLLPLLIVSMLASLTRSVPPAMAQQASSLPVQFKVQSASERMEMTINTSRRLTLDKKIPEAQVNNPDILDLTPLAPNVIQVSAKSPGVTQVNLWDEDRKLYTIDVIVYGDVRELELLLASQFPNASLKVVPVASGVLISGFVDQPEHIDLIIRIAEEYYPKVINNMVVSGVRQVLLYVKVMEISRTKLRALGFDFAKFTGPNKFVSSIAGLLPNAEVDIEEGMTTYTKTLGGNPTATFDIIDPGGAFFGVLEALREDRLGRILAEPTLVAVSGRPAYFRVGGEVGYQLSGGITGPSAEFKQYGTRIDFVAIVLGNGRIRLEVRPLVSELDAANSVGGIPALRTREVDTGVELQAGQTLAIAGLVQNRVEATNRGLPWVSEVPYLGALFRRVEEQNNEVELLIMVTPQLVEAMDAEEVPLCGPGMRTTSPSDWELYFQGHLEVPVCCPGCGGDGCAQCGGEGGDPGMQPYQGMLLPQPGDAGRTAPTRFSQVSTAARPGVVHNRHTPPNPRSSAADSPATNQNAEPLFMGPIGYDVIK
ncbi:MAG: pilus assembly protein N-terminal domain-containing protein [Pirellulales bacterium]|nr:pilus assembly protein N-terminal domain-containing protein [Pirellulales bacterium]